MEGEGLQRGIIDPVVEVEVVAAIIFVGAVVLVVSGGAFDEFLNDANIGVIS